MPYITAAVVAGTAIYGAIDAANRRKKAQKAIEALKKNQPKFKDAASIQAEAEGLIKQGYSPEEVANFQAGLTRGQNQAYRLSTDRNPNLSGAITAGINYSNIGAQNQFAAQDASLRRQRVDQYVGNATGQYNAQTQADLKTKQQQEIAYGNAKSQANDQIYNSISQLGYAGALAGSAYSASGGARSGGANTTSYGTVPTTTNEMGTAIAYPTMTSPYGRVASSTYEGYRAPYDPYAPAPIFSNKTSVPR